MTPQLTCVAHVDLVPPAWELCTAHNQWGHTWPAWRPLPLASTRLGRAAEARAPVPIESVMLWLSPVLHNPTTLLRHLVA